MQTYGPPVPPVATTTPTSALAPEQDAIWSAYQRMRLRLAEHIGREMAQQTGLSEADFEILAYLAESAQTPIRAIALRCGLQWEKSRLSHQLRRMEERALIRRLACPTDNRSFEIAITDLGQAKVASAQAIHARLVDRHVFAALTPDQAQALHAIAEAVLATLTDEPPHTP